MKISRQSWLNYIERLSRLNKTASGKMKAYINTHGLDDDNLVEYAYGIATKYGEGSAALAAEMYDLTAELSGATLEAADPAETASYEEVARAVNGTRKTRNADLVSNAVGRLVKRAGADTSIKNAIRDGAYWAWIPNGDTCAFCLTLASRGWQKASKSVLKGDHASHIHANCDCTFAIRFDKDSSYEGYDPDKYLEMYENAEGSSSKDKINALRREKYHENKDRINEQKRVAYAARKALSGDDKGDIINIDIEEPKQLRIPQIPASTISKKVESGEYSLKLSQQNYDKHVEGTFDYERYRRSREKKGLAPQSCLTITKEEAQNIIVKQSGTGLIKPKRDGTATDIERITCDKAIGYYYNKGKKIPTNKVAIHHGRRGSHLVPIKGNDYD